MIALVPYAFEAEPPGRPIAPIAWSWCALVLALFVLENLVGFGAGSAWLPPSLGDAVGNAVASAQLYAGQDFRPAQLWTYQLIHGSVLHQGGWLTFVHLAVDLVVVGGLGAALERRLGSPILALALALFAPLAGLPFLIHHQAVLPLSGASGVAAGMIGLAWVLTGGERLRVAVVYWLVVVVGAIPFRVRLRWVALAFLAQDLLRARWQHGSGRLGAQAFADEAGLALAGLAAGILLGALVRVGRRR